MNQTATPDDGPGVESELGEPSGLKRTLISFGVIGFLVTQVAIPLSYYWGDEPTSERFSWRMFSSVDLSSWQTNVVAMVEQDGRLQPQTVHLESTLQESFVKTIQRAQFDVIEPFMSKVLERPDVREVHYVALGTFPSGEKMEPIRLVLRRGEPLRKTAK